MMVIRLLLCLPVAPLTTVSAFGTICLEMILIGQEETMEHHLYLLDHSLITQRVEPTVRSTDLAPIMTLFHMMNIA